MAKLGELGPDTLRRGLCFCPLQRCVLQCDWGPGVAGALLSWQAAIYSVSSERSFVLCVTACDVER